MTDLRFMKPLYVALGSLGITGVWLADNISWIASGVVGLATFLTLVGRYYMDKRKNDIQLSQEQARHELEMRIKREELNNILQGRQDETV